MVYISNRAIKEIEDKFGKPELRETLFEMPDYELSMVKNSQKDGRAHDVTVFIKKGDNFIFNAKHWYPKGMCRAPSGGVRPGENIEDGCLREALEETGCAVKLLKYLLRIKCRFTSGDELVDWTSHIFLAEFVSGDLKPIDTNEIREVFVVSPEEIPAIREVMEGVDSGGIHYRAYLTDEVMSILEKNGDLSSY